MRDSETCMNPPIYNILIQSHFTIYTVMPLPQMRARNNFTLFSGWSSAVVLPLDGHCIVQPPSSDPLSNVTSIPVETVDDVPNSKISVFYEADDGSRVRLLDVGCEANPGASEQNINNRLIGIESRYVIPQIRTL